MAFIYTVLIHVESEKDKSVILNYSQIAMVGEIEGDDSQMDIWLVGDDLTQPAVHTVGGDVDHWLQALVG